MHVQYQQPMGMAQNVFRRPMRPKKKAGQHVANPDNVRRTIYICDIASKVRRATAHCRDCTLVHGLPAIHHACQDLPRHAQA